MAVSSRPEPTSATRRMTAPALILTPSAVAISQPHVKPTRTPSTFVVTATVALLSLLRFALLVNSARKSRLPKAPSVVPITAIAPAPAKSAPIPFLTSAVCRKTPYTSAQLVESPKRSRHARAISPVFLFPTVLFVSIASASMMAPSAARSSLAIATSRRPRCIPVKREKILYFRRTVTQTPALLPRVLSLKPPALTWILVLTNVCALEPARYVMTLLFRLLRAVRFYVPSQHACLNEPIS